ncbi:MAG: hypothetical protein KGH98_04890 [Candidatus Micrarchaeota archaeon]|nr:hypothetical protein [Candidatus Micrarchaeota archaeon]
MEKLLEKIGLASIGLDAIVAVATLFVIKNVAYSGDILILSDYLVFIEVIVAAILVAMLLMLRYYGKTMKVIGGAIRFRGRRY